MVPDFQGYATKANLLCADGRTIMPNAFKGQDGATVPLVWQHGHKDPTNVLGHAKLEAREDGVYAYAYFNDTEKAQHTKKTVIHGDINMMSIWANQLVQRGKSVLHGVIREVSLVLAGANPGAIIENVTIRHADGDEELDDEAIIYTGLHFEHADSDTEEDDSDDSEDETIRDVYETMTDKQKNVLHYLLAQAIGEEAEESDDTEKSEELSQSAQDSDTEETTMTHNVFENGGDAASQTTLSHSEMKAIVEDAVRLGSFKDAVNAYALAHNIVNIDVLFPEAQAVTRSPEWFKRQTEWVSTVLGGASKTPFSRVKSWTADLTYEEARAKGYVKGNMKKEEFFSVAKRETTPQTIYKKQKLDRDDIIDITDFDVVAWMKGEMRLMLDEELARAVLVGDGRDVGDDDKIRETNIRSILNDDAYYVITVSVDTSKDHKGVLDAVDAAILNRQYYKGSGTPTFFTTETFLAQCLTVRDTDGRRIYRTVADLAAEMRVAAIVPVEVLEGLGVHGILVNMSDYVIGADRGGAVSMFEDFDIDYNQNKYLIETRVSGALVKPQSAIVLRESVGETFVTPGTPTQDPETKVVTIPTVTGVVYHDAAGNVLTGDVTIPDGSVLRVQAYPDAGKAFDYPVRTSWSFMGPEAINA